MFVPIMMFGLFCFCFLHFQMIRHIPKNVKWIFDNLRLQRGLNAAITKRNYTASSPNVGASGQTLFTHSSSEGYIRNSPMEHVTTPNQTLDEYVWQNATRFPNHIAVVMYEFCLIQNVGKMIIYS